MKGGVGRAFVYNRVWRGRQEGGMLGGGVPVLDTDQPRAERGPDRARQPTLVPAIEPGPWNQRLGGGRDPYHIGEEKMDVPRR